MPRPRKDNGREVFSLSLPGDMAEEVARKAEAAGMTRAEYVRNTMAIGMTARDDITTLARAVRDIRHRPRQYSLSTRLTLWDACRAALDNYTGDAPQLPGDKEELELYERKVGPYQIAENGWVCGPFKRKEFGETYRYQIPDGEPTFSESNLSMPIRVIELLAQPLEWTDGSLFWVYTNAEMTPAATKVFQQNILETWDRLEVRE